MPRGIYPRKPKGEKAAQSAPAAKKPAAKTQTQKSSPALSTKESAESAGQYVPAAVDQAARASFAFQILGANVSTLVSAHESIHASSEVIAKLLRAEITETIAALTALRKETFGWLVKEESAQAPLAAFVPETQDGPAVGPPCVAPVAAPPPPPTHPAPTLPQGNAGYHPPAPPILPQH